MAEVASITIDEARDLVANQALWSRVRDFLWDFAPQIHTSWLDGLSGHEALDARREDGSSIVSSLSSSWRIKKSILDSLHIEPCFHTFPKDDGSRILLLEGATLESIAKWLGALACADALRRVTSGATVRELKAGLPGIYPEVFGYTAYFGSLEACKKGEGESLSGEIISNGYAMLFSSIADLPEPLLNRFVLKLPKSESSKLPGRDAPNFQTSKPLSRQLLLKLLKLRFPEAHSLCCL